MDREKPPHSKNDLLAAMADGELDLRMNRDALDQLADDPHAAQRVAFQQQLKQACGQAMDRPEMKCPADLAAKLRAIALDTPQAHRVGESTEAGSARASSAPYLGPPVLARIGRWVPAAVAAVLLIAAGVVFSLANPGGDGGVASQQAAFLSIDKIDQFTGRHGDCAKDTGLLKESQRFGDATAFSQLPGRLADYFHASTDGMRLSLDGIGYHYQLTGACPLPGTGAVHVVYRHQDNPERAISLWLMPARVQHAALQEGRVYVEAGSDLMHPVIFWRQGDMLYYLVGDSMEDANKAVQTLRQTA